MKYASRNIRILICFLISKGIVPGTFGGDERYRRHIQGRTQKARIALLLIFHYSLATLKRKNFFLKVTIAAVAIRWVLQQPAVGACILGMRLGYQFIISIVQRIFQVKRTFRSHSYSTSGGECFRLLVHSNACKFGSYSRSPRKR